MNSKEDLLKLLEEAPEGRGGVNPSNNVITFISRFNIISGDKAVPAKILFRLYRTSTKNPVNKSQFIRHITDHLVTYNNGNNTYFKINLDSMRISDEISKLTELGKQKKVNNLQHVRTFERYLSKNSIERGNNWIEGFVLFELFAKPIRGAGRQVSIGHKQFIQFCRLYFEEKRIGSSRNAWFGISKGIMKKVSIAEIDRIRNKRRRNVEKKRRSKKKDRKQEPCIETKEGEVPSVEAGTTTQE